MMKLVEEYGYCEFISTDDGDARIADVFVIDDEWRAATRLFGQPGFGDLGYQEVTRRLRTTHRPDLPTAMAPWALFEHPRIARVYMGPFLTRNTDWVAGILRSRLLTGNELFLVDHQDRERENSAYDSIHRLVDARVDPRRIFSFTNVDNEQIMGRINKDFGVRDTQLLLKSHLRNRPTEEVERILKMADSAD